MAETHNSDNTGKIITLIFVAGFIMLVCILVYISASDADRADICVLDLVHYVQDGCDHSEDYFLEINRTGTRFKYCFLDENGRVTKSEAPISASNLHTIDPASDTQENPRVEISSYKDTESSPESVHFDFYIYDDAYTIVNDHDGR